MHQYDHCRRDSACTFVQKLPIPGPPHMARGASLWDDSALLRKKVTVLRALLYTESMIVSAVLLSIVVCPAYGAPQAPALPTPAALKNLSLEELSQIEVITPSKEPVKAIQVPAAIYVITGEDIKRSGATSIPEALRMAPGVEVARIDANKWSIGIRGFGSRLTRSVLVIIDGRTVFTPLFDGTYWEVQDTMMDDIDRIEVIRGPGGTIWGPNAVNGVINVITKDSRDTHGMLSSAGGGNEEQGFVNFRYGGGNGNGLDYRFYGKAFTRSPEVHPDGANFDDWRAGQGGFRMDWRPNGRDTFTLQGDIYDEAAGERVQVVTYAAPYSQNVDANALLSGGNTVGRWERVISDRNSIRVQFYYDRTNRHEPNFGELRNSFDFDFLQRVSLPARQRISWGFGARADPLNDLPVVSGLTFLPAKRTDYLLSGFLQDEIGLVENRLSLTLGSKVISTNATHGVGVEPSARLLWSPTAKQSFWAAYTHALRTPSDSETNFNLSGYVGPAGDGNQIFARFNANPSFAPEQLNGYEVGYRQLVGSKVFIDTTAFYNHYHDLFSEDITGPIFFEETPAPAHYLLPAQFGNGLLGNTKGIEVAPEWRPTSWWRLRGSYSYLHMSLARSPGSEDVGTAPGIMGSSPAHMASVDSAVDFSKTLRLDLMYRFVSSLPGQTIPVPAYSTGDASFGWRFKPGLELALVGRNLLQPSHPEYYGDPGPLVAIKRSAYVKITWSK
jgi:iron complex outermembrane receptor protein